MINTKRDKYDEVARDLCKKLWGMNYPQESNDWLGVAAFLRSAFPPPAEDARKLVASIRRKEIEQSATHGAGDWTLSAEEAAADIEAFARSRVKPWRDALNKYGQHLYGCDFMKGWPYHPERKICTCGLHESLSDDDAKEATS